MAAPSSDQAGIRQTIRALRAAGYDLAFVDDGGEQEPVSTEDEAIEAIMAVDAAHLFVRKPGVPGTRWVLFVMGNDPEEVICDHGIGLSDVLDPLTDGWWE